MGQFWAFNWVPRAGTRLTLLQLVLFFLFLNVCLSAGAINGLSGNAYSANARDKDQDSCSWPSVKLGSKNYYIGHFFKASWFKAWNYCRFHGMHLASIESKAENDQIEKTVQEFGFGNEHFWTSGTDLGEEGEFSWFGVGRPVGYTNWNAGEPNNFRYENGEEEHCLELWNRDGKGLKWNDTPCSFETYFICER